MFLHREQRGKIAGVETIDSTEARQWAAAGLEGKIVRRFVRVTGVNLVYTVCIFFYVCMLHVYTVCMCVLYVYMYFCMYECIVYKYKVVSFFIKHIILAVFLL